MPVLKHQLIVDIARGIRGFLSLEAGLVRTETPAGGPRPDASEEPNNVRGVRKHRVRDLSQAKLIEQRERVEKQGQELADSRASLRDDSPGATDLNPENIVWIFGDGRSGTTWLASMMGSFGEQVLWREPNVGTLFGLHYYVWATEKQRQMDNFILGLHKDGWLNSIRNFVLSEARSRFPALSESEYLVIKEPFGSVGAPLLMQALPESRMIFLVRDPRDVVASAMDARKKGAWSYWRTKAAEQGGDSLAERDPDTFVAERAEIYLRNVGNSKEAYDAHRGSKVLIRYEELRSDTLGTMKRLYASLGINVEEERLAEVVEKRSWENIPEEKKGEGKFHRKATPGGWKEDLTPEQAEIVERITAPLLKEFYSV